MVDGDTQDHAEGHDLHSVGIGKKMDVGEIGDHLKYAQICIKTTGPAPLILKIALKALGCHCKLKIMGLIYIGNQRSN